MLSGYRGIWLVHVNAVVCDMHACVDMQHSVDLITFQDQSKQIETLQRDKELLTEDVASLQSRIDYLQTSTVDSEVVTRLEAKVRDLEAKFDLEQTSRSRAEVTELATLIIMKYN